MKIALINPTVPGSLKKENLGLAYLAASLEADGHTTRILDEIAGQDVEVGLDVLRPPTFDALAQRLRDRPGHYQLVHLDAVAITDQQGTMLFEDAAGGADPVDPSRVATALAGALFPLGLLTSGPCHS